MILIANPINLDFVFGCLIGFAYARVGERQTIGTALLFGTLLLVTLFLLGNFNTGIAT
jgi:exopolysaccharide production protein ExoZ